jgi:hypothetical protein
MLLHKEKKRKEKEKESFGGFLEVKRQPWLVWCGYSQSSRCRGEDWPWSDS